MLVALVIGTYIVVSPPTWVIYKQLSTIRSGDWIKAYGYTSQDFQTLTSFDDFSTFLEQTPVIQNSDSLSIEQENETMDFNSKDLTVKGVLKDKEGQETPIVFELIRSKDIKGILSGWKINMIKVQQNGLWKTLTVEEDTDSNEGT